MRAHLARVRGIGCVILHQPEAAGAEEDLSARRGKESPRWGYLA